jgi:hypothetical protein
MHGLGDAKKLIVTKSGLIFHHTSKEICGKPFAAVICCDNVEDETPKNLVSISGLMPHSRMLTWREYW